MPEETPSSPEAVSAEGLPICPLCLRPIPPDVPQSLHHLVPKLRGGKGGPVVLMHHICHREIHATLSETELARSYNTIEALRAHPRLSKFAAWVARRPASFTSKIPGRRRNKR
ncbi:MAG: HNH endonuclease [Rhodobacteraceae bacterium]|nr:MAG: HNH endonuclease [Paracoccaceae bacterium]